ncbi:MAG: DUF333 domain-containing protein [Sulfurovum sp.]|nr:MAG: DUF333 domain-containing protein [Sulfurovum sp.]
MKKIYFISPILLMNACSNSDANLTIKNEPVQMANPASVNCINKGGKLEMRTDKDGGTYGVCIFKNGKECEEWAFFRNECKDE